MKIRLFLAITFILFSITSGIEVIGMNENLNDNNEEEEYKDGGEKRTSNFNINNGKENEGNEISTLMKNLRRNIITTHNQFMMSMSNSIPMSKGKRNIDFSKNGEKINELQENTNDLINTTKPFEGEKRKDLLFRFLFKRVECIYEGTLGITLFEILASFGISILNNILGFEKMDKNKFYANMFLLKFGFKLGIPILSFIIVDFNICIYSWLVSGIKYLMFFYNKTPLERLDTRWKAKSFDKIFKFICLFNAFNIDIKLNIFGLTLCIPLTKILEALLIGKLIQEFGYTKIIYASVNETGEIYQAIYNTVEGEKYKEAEGIMNKINKASKEGLSTLKEISTQAVGILLSKNDNNNNNNSNTNNINNISVNVDNNPNISENNNNPNDNINENINIRNSGNINNIENLNLDNNNNNNEVEDNN